MSSVLTSPAAKTIEELLGSVPVQSAFRFFDHNVDKFTAEQIRLCSIPAPPFAEKERAAYLCERFREVGLTGSHLDEEGNCVALREGSGASPLLIVSAHLDTVFPAGTDCTVRTHNNRLMAPGISDDACGLSALTALAEALEHSHIATRGSLLFVGTVGEEGEGNLRGVRHLLTRGAWANRATAFLSFDGPGITRITNGAVGSRRYRVALRGIGGHSWGDFGIANPVHAIARAVSTLVSYPTPTAPRTTFNVGRILGGTGVNAIASEATMEVDLRSASEEELLRLDAFFRRALSEAVQAENSSTRKGDQPLQLNLSLIGQRPGGETPPGSAIVEVALEATRALGFIPRLDRASTDANFPISLGLPAITLGGGGTSGSSHTLDEWYDPRGREHGLKRALLVLLASVGMKEG